MFDTAGPERQLPGGSVAITTGYRHAVAADAPRDRAGRASQPCASRKDAGHLAAGAQQEPAPTIVTRQHLEQSLHAQGLPAPNLAVETIALSFMRAMTFETDRLAFVPAVTLAPGRECAGLVPAAIAWLDWDRPVGLTLRRRGVLSPACQRLVAELRKVCAERFPGYRPPQVPKGRRPPAGRVPDHHGLV
jgi:DNA-binding transcriptional LysR family regulator